jgi:hypothetical protein
MIGGLVSPPDSRNNSPIFPSGSSSTLPFPNSLVPDSIDNRRLNALQVSSSHSIDCQGRDDFADQEIARSSLDAAVDQMDVLLSKAVVSVPSTSESLESQGPSDFETNVCSSSLDSSRLLPIDDFPMTLSENSAFEEVEEADDEMNGSSSKKVASLDHEDVVMTEVDPSLDDPMAGMVVSNDVTSEKVPVVDDNEDEYVPAADVDPSLDDPMAGLLSKMVVSNDVTSEKVPVVDDDEDEYVPAADEEDDPPADDEEDDPPAYDEEEDLPPVVVKPRKQLSDSGESEANPSDLSSDEESVSLESQLVDKINNSQKTNQTSADSDSESYSGSPVIPPEPIEPRRSSRNIVSKNKGSAPLATQATSSGRKRKPVIKNNRIVLKVSF